MSQPTFNVLFLCQQNAGRSLMAEAMLNKVGKGCFYAFSAGFEPTVAPNPVAMQVLEREGFDTSSLQPKHFSVFLEDDAPALDFVFTLCADSEQEAKLSIWNELSADTITAHWHFAEPHHTDDDADAVSEYDRYGHVQRELAQRLRLLMNLPEDKLVRISNHPEAHILKD